MSKNKKIITIIYLKIIFFTVVKNQIILHRRVFVMIKLAATLLTTAKRVLLLFSKHCTSFTGILTQCIHPFFGRFNGTKAYEETSTDEKTVVNSHSNDEPYKFAVDIKERQDKLHTMYWLPKLTKKRVKLDSLPTLALALQHNIQN